MLCGVCGLPLSGDLVVCTHHDNAFADDWAEGNRRVCAFVHRKMVPPHEPLSEQDAADLKYL
jgi:hypothetical protein